jgi:hypothetical protein
VPFAVVLSVLVIRSRFLFAGRFYEDSDAAATVGIALVRAVAALSQGSGDGWSSRSYMYRMRRLATMASAGSRQAVINPR